MAGQRHPRLASHERRPYPGSLLPALPAAGDGRSPRSSAPGRRHAWHRGERRVRQPARSSQKRTRSLSGGNFHAEPVAFAADMIAMALCEIGSLAERRIAMLVDPSLSGLPAFLTPHPGLNSGFMIPQVTAAALVSENKQRAYPASVDSIPTSANQEDHVSMAAHGARRLLADGPECRGRGRDRVACRSAGLRLPRADALQRAARTVARTPARAGAVFGRRPLSRARNRTARANWSRPERSAAAVADDLARPFTADG